MEDVRIDQVRLKFEASPYDPAKVTARLTPILDVCRKKQIPVLLRKIMLAATLYEQGRNDVEMILF